MPSSLMTYNSLFNSHCGSVRQRTTGVRQRTKKEGEIGDSCSGSKKNEKKPEIILPKRFYPIDGLFQK